jgi:CxxC-x17-CxxC domain-containing protein
MNFQDKTLVCRDCGKDFVFSASEQEFYQKKGFENEPVRCPDCRALKKQRMNQDRPQRQMFEITCAECGKTDTVPFKPKGDRPVLCRDCFRKQRA